MTDMPVTQLAADYLAGLGISVLRMHPSRDKRPDGNWKEFQSRRLTPQDTHAIFADGPPLGVVTGAISGNLVMAEVEGRAQGLIVQVRDLAHDSGLGDLWDKVDRGWKEISPSGGVHWFFRTQSPPEGNRKLARRPSTEAELVEWKERETAAAQDIPDAAKRALRLQKIENTTQNDVIQVLAETRGEGGFVVVAPTPGHFHETGNPWRMARNCSPGQVPTLTDDEAEAFLGLLATLDVPIPGREVQHGPRKASPFQHGAQENGVSPGDDYERVPWEEILIPHGWKLAFEAAGGVKYWTRPGKSMGVSASTGRDPERDRLYVFTTSTSFDSEVPYTKFGAYAHLVHDNDYKAAASQLRKDGFGRDPELHVAPTPPRIEAPPSETRTRQDWAPGNVPGRAEGSSAAAPALAPVVDIKSRSKKEPAATTTISAYTEEANAQRFVNDHGSILRYDSASKRWFVWEDSVNRWVRQDDGETGGKAMQLLRTTIRELPADTEVARKWRAKSMSWSQYRNTMKIAQGFPGVGVTATAFDRAAWELNTPAGPIDLHTGKLLPAAPEKMHSKSTMVAPDPAADKGPWLRFLADTFPNNQPLIDYLQLLAGLTLIGEVREHLLIFGYGTGGNGKGVFMEVMGALLGDYRVSANGEFLMKKQQQQHPEEIARLNGARMFIISEIDPTARFDQGRANLLSGGDVINARYMHGSTFEFAPTHLIWMTGNHLPKVVGHGEEGFWRRLKLVPFLHSVPDDRIDPVLKNKLIHDHGPAVLAWMVEGAVRYSQNGLGMAPPDVVSASKAYRTEADTVQSFLDDECQVTPPAERNEGLQTPQIPNIPVQQFFERYERWCKDNKETAIGKRKVAARLAAAGIRADPNRRINGRTAYLWVELNDKTQSYPPPPGNQFGQQMFNPGEKVD